MIKLTVALPVWNSKKILWLALEGLCRQEQAPPWELLIMEEQIDHFGADEVAKYADRLSRAGCVSVKYYPLDNRIPLPKKWKLLAGKRSPDSIGFLLQAADCYPEPLRLKRTYDALNEGYEWIQNKRGYFYSLHYKTVIEFDILGYGGKTGLNMAITTKLLHLLPDSFQNSGIDSWFFTVTDPKKVLWIEGEIRGGVDTDGLNNISWERRHNFYDPKKPFNKTDMTIDELLPSDVLEKLKLVIPR